MALTATAVTVAVVGAALLFPQNDSAADDRPRAAATPPNVDTVAGCTEQRRGEAYAWPSATTDGERLGLVFCPVEINGGTLPITGPFELSGQVLGPIGVREQVLLIGYGDPRTCDAWGNRPAPEGFLASHALIDSTDGRWSYVDNLGYPGMTSLPVNDRQGISPGAVPNSQRLPSGSWNSHSRVPWGVP